MAKNIILALLAVLVIAGIVFGVIFYRQSLMDSRTISKMGEKIARLDVKNEAADKQRDALHKELVAKSRALQSAQKTLAELRNTVQIKDREHRNSKEKINDLEKSGADLNKKLAVQQDAVKSFKLQLEKKRAEMTVLRNQIAQLHQALGAKQSEVEETQNEFRRQKEALARLKAHQVSTGSSAADLKEQLKSSQSRLVVCLNRTQTAQKNKEQLQQKITSLQEQKNQIESTLAGTRAASRELVSKLHKQIQNQQIVITQYKEKLTVRVLDRILFASGMANITPEGQELLRKVGTVLKGISGETIQIIGNTDSVPIAPQYRYRYASNWELSAARAATVARFFQQKCGIDPKDMLAMGRSAYHPVASNSTPAGRARNRNVEIVIKPKLERKVQSALAAP